MYEQCICDWKADCFDVCVMALKSRYTEGKLEGMLDKGSITGYSSLQPLPRAR